MADTSDCCGGPNGKHLDGCAGGGGNTRASAREVRRRGRQASDYQKAKDRDAANFNKKADEFIAKRQAGSGTYTPNPYPGVTMERWPGQGHAQYRYVRR